MTDFERDEYRLGRWFRSRASRADRGHRSVSTPVASIRWRAPVDAWGSANDPVTTSTRCDDSDYSGIPHSSNRGSGEVRWRVRHYNPDVIVSVGCRVKSTRGTQFRIWANGVLMERRDILLDALRAHCAAGAYADRSRCLSVR